MNAHPEIVDRFSPLVDAELPPAEVQEVEAHLSRCPSCRAEWEDFAEAVALLRDLPRERLPSAFTRRVVARTRIERRRRRLRLQTDLLPLAGAQIILPIALLAAVAAVVLLLLI